MNSNNNLTSQAYELILDHIVRSEFQPGEKLSAQRLEQDLGLGRTPIREALLRLTQEGLVYTRPQSGTFVTKIDLQKANNARFIRETMERQIVREACQSADSLILRQAEDAVALQKQFAADSDYQRFFEADGDFHRAFYLMTNHAAVWDWLQTVNIQLDRFRFVRLSLHEFPWDFLIDQHLEILEAVKSHDTGVADAAVKKHLHMVLDEEREVVRSHREWFENVI